MVLQNWDKIENYDTSTFMPLNFYIFATKYLILISAKYLINKFTAKYLILINIDT